MSNRCKNISDQRFLCFGRIFRNFSKYFKFQLVKMNFYEKIARKSFPKINTKRCKNIIRSWKNVPTLIGKSWKTHPEIFLKFSFSGSSHRPFYWKTHPLKIISFKNLFSFFQFWGVTQNIFLENSSIRIF